MAYTVADLTTLGACDAYLSEKNQDNSRLQNAIANLQFVLQNGTNVQSIAQEIAALEAAIAQQEAHISTLADGRDRRKKERELRNYQDDLSRLLDRQESTGPDVRLDREFRLYNLQDTLANIQELIEAVNVRRAALVDSGIVT